MENLNNVEISGLILGVRSGEDEAFSELVRRYMPMIKKVVSGFTGSAVRSDEAFCEASVAFYRAAMTYDLSRTDVTFGLYARICVYRRLCDLAGKEMKREELLFDLDVDSLAVNSGVEAALLEKEQISAALCKLRTMLSPYEYEVFLLYLQGYSTAAIAEKLARSSKSVDNAKARCFKRLRRESDSFSDI